MDLKQILNALFTGLNAHIDHGFAAVVKALGGQKEIGASVRENSRALGAIGVKFEKAIDRLTKKEFDVLVDLGPLEKEFGAITAELKTLNAREKLELDTEGIEMALVAILKAVQANAPEKLGEKFDAMDVVFKGLKPKDSVRFDDAQMKGLMAALTGSRGSITTNPGLKSATNWEVDKVALTSANTQYSYTFPSNTVSWTFKLRAQGATLFYSDVTGKLPVSGDNSTYMTMLPLGARSQDGMEWGGKTMYFESDTASQTVEIEIFTM